MFGASVAIIIPAYRPGPELIETVDALLPDGLPIIVVDDGSGGDFHERFGLCDAKRGVVLLRHETNRGKGAALKTAFRYVLENLPDVSTVITVDADGQHHPDDVRSVAKKAVELPESIILGAREFGPDVPARSRFGNVLTRMLYRVLLGQSLSDTQTGLRAIPRTFLPTLIAIPSMRYEFELDGLIAAKHANRRFAEVKIQTIYTNNNESSHFRPVRDSMRISMVLVRFAAASLLTAIVDNLVFAACFYTTGTLWLSQVAGRSVAVIVNYSLARRAVFHSKAPHREVAPRYLALVATVGITSYFLIAWLARANIMPVLVAKIVVESILFYGNFLIQRDRIFTAKRNGPTATDWTEYYQSSPKAAQLTRQYTTRVLIHALTEVAGCSKPGTSRIVEIGGANSCFFDAIARDVQPREYHVIDSNAYGMELLEKRIGSRQGVVLHRGDIRTINAGIEADVVFSVGLIEHFDERTTRAVIDEHFRMAKHGGFVILSYPTPTALYRAARSVAELLRAWKFHDERPLQRDEVARAAQRNGVILWQKLLWPIVFTQHLMVIRKT